MRETNIKNLDLNLLVALNALLEEKSVTRAAARINLSQPATSRALSRLRDMFQDPLLVKGARGMVLTARANDLYQPLQHILSDITSIVSPPSIDPATMQGEVVIATRDYESAVILPKIINRITAESPNLTLRIVPLIGDDLSSLENPNVDFILTATDSKAATLHRYIVYKESFICLASKDNSIIQKEMNLETYVAAKHCLITISGFGLGVVDTLLAQKNLKRNIFVRIPHFLAVGHIIADSDLIVTLPRRLGELLSQQHRIVLINPPLKIPQFPIYLYWHARNQNNPIHQWIRKMIQTSYGKSGLLKK